MTKTIAITRDQIIDDKDIDLQLRNNFNDIPAEEPFYEALEPQRKALEGVIEGAIHNLKLTSIDDNENTKILSETVAPSFSAWLTNAVETTGIRPNDYAFRTYLQHFQREFPYLQASIVFDTWVHDCLRPAVFVQANELANTTDILKLREFVYGVIWTVQFYDETLNRKQPLADYFSGKTTVMNSEKVRGNMLQSLFETFHEASNTTAMTLLLTKWLETINSDHKHASDYEMYWLKQEYETCLKDLQQLAISCSLQSKVLQQMIIARKSS